MSKLTLSSSGIVKQKTIKSSTFITRDENIVYVVTENAKGEFTILNVYKTREEALAEVRAYLLLYGLSKTKVESILSDKVSLDTDHIFTIHKKRIQ